MTLIQKAFLPMWLMRHYLTIVFFLIATQSNHLDAQENNKPVLALYEIKRELVVLPLENNSNYKDLDYLQNGISQFLVSNLSDIVYIRVKKAEMQFLINPENASLNELKNHNKYLPGSKSKKPYRIERLRLVSRFEKPNKKNWTVLNLSDIKDQANRLSADYLVRGHFELNAPNSRFERYQLSRQEIKITIEMLDVTSSRIYTWQKIQKIDNIYKKHRLLSQKIKQRLLGKLNSSLSVSTTHANALVFIDDLYLGKSPLQVETLPGSYTLGIFKEGLQTIKRSVVLKKGKKLSLHINTKKNVDIAGLNINSNQKDASVYLNMKYIGKTPLKRMDLPAGTHRIRISKKGYIDRIKGILLINNKTKTLTLDMKKGHTQTAFLDPGYVLFDWTLYDMSFYSMISSFTFYMGFIYFDIEASQIRQSIRKSIQEIAIFDFLDTLQNNPPLFLYQWDLIQKNSRKASQYDNAANVSAGIGISMIFAAVYLFYEAVDQDEKRDTGAVSWFIHHKQNQNVSGFVKQKRGERFVQNSRYEFGLNYRY